MNENKVLQGGVPQNWTGERSGILESYTHVDSWTTQNESRLCHHQELHSTKTETEKPDGVMICQYIYIVTLFKRVYNLVFWILWNVVSAVCLGVMGFW
jgi:hypothetical protein